MRITVEELSKANQNIIRSFTGGEAREKRFPIIHQELARARDIEKFMEKGNYTLNDVFEQIENKECRLSSEQRKFFLMYFKGLEPTVQGKQGK